jgi:hypothetical protein
VSAEDYCEGRLLVIRRIDRDEPLREYPLPLMEVSASYDERLAVDVEPALDALQSLIRLLVPAVRQLGRRVELLELVEHGLGLSTLGGDLVRVRTARSRPE